MGKPKGKKPPAFSKAKIWQKDDIDKTLAEIHAGKTICGSAKKYGMAESTLCNRLKMISEGRDLVGSGRCNVLSQKEEESLAKCITALCNSGFSPTADEIKNLVRD